jgi:alkanesulfonate monooxygenase SsuD/methylene tetrahydromethanopterin reductase-like flavin-dependent oxidoreductase (luciferase family)
VGAGWSRGEYDAAGVDFSTRGRRLDESIVVCRELWTAETPSAAGPFFPFGPLCFEPKPPQGSVPILIGGESDAALRRAATIGDGWIGMQDTVEVARERAAAVRSHGRDVQVVTGGYVSSVEDLRAYHDAGVNRLIVSPWRRSADALDGIRGFAEQVLRPAREQGLLSP